MKFTADIPDHYRGQNLYLVTRSEMVAYREFFRTKKDGKTTERYGPVKVKTESCNGCGECCEDCVFIRSDGCPFGEQIPMSCMISDCSRDKKLHPNCSEKFK